MNDKCNQATAPNISKRLRIEPCQNGGFLVEREGERHLQTERFGAFSNARDMIEALMAEFGVDAGDLMRYEPTREIYATTERSAALSMLDEGFSMSEEDDWPPGEDQTEPTPPAQVHQRLSAYLIGDEQELTLPPGEQIYTMVLNPDGGFSVMTQRLMTDDEIMIEAHQAAKDVMQASVN